VANLQDNADDVFGHVQAIIDGINLEATVAGGILGEDLLDTAAMAILQRSIQQQSAPGGGAWAANATKYAEYKQRKGVDRVGIGVSKATEADPSRRMLSLPQVQGRRAITAEEAVAEYGLDDDANRKGQWFTAGSAGADGCEPSGATNQPPRPFYDLDESDREEIERRAEDLVGQLLRDLGA
jgi:hypothetical protein